MQWYLDALYLNQGHSFFAPDVGPGHVIHYELFDRNNRVIAEGTLPDKKEHRPRLFYHRHMMLADQADVPTDDGPQSINWQRKYLEAYARHLLRVNKDAQSARVQNYAHWPLPSSYVMEGRKRGYEMLMRDFAQQGQNRRIDEQGFEMIAEAVQRRSDLPPEPEDQTSMESEFELAGRAFQRGRSLDGRPTMIAATRSYLAEVWEAWNEFWFAPSSPTTLSAIRVLAGAMLLYTHLVWSIGLTDFFSDSGWLPQQLMHEVHHDGGDPDGPGPATGPPPAATLDLVALQPHPLDEVDVDDSHRKPMCVLPVDGRLV
jgi:hypothetical protein